LTVPPPPGSGIDRLIAIMAQLRNPDGGCPWDLEQNFQTIAPYTIEEAYEVADAIEKNDIDGLKDELGDLLLQVVFHGRMAEELGLFDFSAIADACSDKMIRRHPHVFGPRGDITSAADQLAAWEATKAIERADKAANDSPHSALDGVAAALPGLTRAAKIQKRAARVGFDWTEPAPILDKIEEEIAEVRHELAVGSGPDRLEDEVGDLLFAVTNLARRLELDPEATLRRATLKFERRFRRMEALADQKLEGRTADQLDALWNQVKAEER
jgi:ATP diphosphatase